MLKNDRTRDMIDKLKKVVDAPEWVICVLLAVFAMALNVDTLHAGFVADDKGLIVNSEIIHSVDNAPQYFVQAFSTRGMDERSTEERYRGLTVGYIVQGAFVYGGVVQRLIELEVGNELNGHPQHFTP